ncbi:MAG: hypothetical protein HRF45_00220 [Fimbriimonadia bacterium]|jgi:hypothetical protein
MPEEPPVLEWTVSLSSQQPEKVAAVLVAAAFAGLVGFFVAGSVALAVVGPAVVLGATSEFLLPVRYRIAEDGASARWGINVTHIAWKDVKRARADAHGVKLLPLEKPSRLEAFRGVYLRFGDRKQEVERAVGYWYRNDATLG